MVAGHTLCAASTVEKEFEGKGGNKEAARKIGQTIAERALKKGIETVVLTGAAISTTGASRPWLRAPARAA